MQNQNMNVERAYRTLVTIWAMLFISLFLFLVVIYFTRPEVYRFDFSQPLLGREPVFVLALAAVSIANFAASFFLSGKELRHSVEEQSIGRVQTAMIIGCAMSESAALFGLLLVFVQDYQYFFLFFALAALGFILHFPRRDNLAAASYRS